MSDELKPIGQRSEHVIEVRESVPLIVTATVTLDVMKSDNGSPCEWSVKFGGQPIGSYKIVDNNTFFAWAAGGQTSTSRGHDAVVKWIMSTWIRFRNHPIAIEPIRMTIGPWIEPEPIVGQQEIIDG